MQVICEVRSRIDGKFIRSFVVDHSTHEGRAKTAIAAREAMEAGHLFLTQPKDGLRVVSKIEFALLTVQR